MRNSRKIIGLTVVVIAVVAFAAAYLFSSARERGGTQQGGTQQEENQVWWIASDPHLGNSPNNPFDSLQVAIQDVDNLGITDHAAILGDILNNSGMYADNFFQLMDNLKVENWYYVLGNHDSNQSVSIGENFLPILYYGIDVLGIRFVFISTEGSGLPTYGGVMGANQFTWLENELEMHSNQPVFMFSHQPWYQWNVWDNLTLTIEGERNVKVWFCGHLHEWVINENVKPYNLIEVCDSSLDWAEHYNGVFMFLQRKGDTVDVTLKFRNHMTHEWISVPKVGGGTIDNLSFSVKVA